VTIRARALWFGSGMVVTLLAVNLLYGARNHPYPDGNWGAPAAYYVIGEDRFDWFRRGEHVPNAWGGFTLDGRRITFVSASHYYLTPRRE
jgi:hypothetical protein